MILPEFEYFLEQPELRETLTYAAENCDQFKSKMSRSKSGFSNRLVPWTRAEFGVMYDECTEHFDSVGKEVAYARFFMTPPNSTLRAHIDGHIKSPSRYGFNIPISQHKSNHFMEWYSYESDVRLIDNEYSKSIQPVDYSKLVLEERLCVTVPTYVRIGIMHAVINKTNYDRLILSIRFKDSFI